MVRAMRRMVVLVMAMVAVWVVVGVFSSPKQATGASTPVEVTSYTVQPGQSLWTYAEMITPEGGDVSASVDELKRLNGMDGTQVRVGQRIIVPEEPDETGGER
ncbi:peptidoglycan-binding protein [Bifidobacterium stellenboschense]|uniref:Peptidoglycan-binding protein n=2 Tax=Bifidobacterium stellenboschense TaxID=762211 RepID=A0A087DQT3_9BIFI|nr:peptidoglycan-binding protein [Bifidobacterium stellenboschense]